MRLLPALALLTWANALADARGERLEHGGSDVDCSDSREPRGVSALWDDDICSQWAAEPVHEEAHDQGLIKRWRQWVRQADPTTNAAAAQPTADDNKDEDANQSEDAKEPAADTNAADTKAADTKAADTKAAEETSAPAETKEEPAEEEKPTEAEKTEEKETKAAETTQKEEETKEEPTIEQPTVPSITQPTVPSPTLPTQTLPSETESEDSETTDPASTQESAESFLSDTQTYSSYSSEKIGASCFSTTIEHTTICSTRTRNGQIESHGCAPANITSSTCAPGMMCTIHPESGNDVCMKLNNEVGTAGIIIAAIFGALGAACTFTMVFICYQDKRAAKKFRERRPPKTSESARLLGKAVSPPTAPSRA